MKQKDKSMLTPKLRFPEFRDEPGWEAQPLDSVSQFVKKKIPLPQLNLDTYVSTENLSPDYGGIEQASKLPPNGSATEYKPGDILIANIRPYLKKVWRSNRSGGASNDVIVIRPEAVLRNDYLPMVIANDAFIKYVMKTAKGVKMPRGDIASIKDYIVHYPPPPEQQKIAECMSSLDELITAEDLKLEALKAHKNGLMQQLFPQPGEIQPRLRFPEFRKGRGWKSVKLSKVFEEYREKSTVQDQYEVLTSARRGLIRQIDYYGEGRITGRDNIGFNIIPPNYITYRSRADDRQFFFNENNLGIIGIISTYYPVFRLVEGSNKFFIELLAHHRATVGKYSVGTSQTVLSLPMLGRVKLPLPTPAEQQMIADCLAAMDDSIAAQEAKIDALKTHKRGLMQQLFPVPEEQ